MRQHKLPYHVLEHGFFEWADQFAWAQLALDETSEKDLPFLDELNHVAKQIADTEKLTARFEKIANDPDDDLFESIVPKYREAIARKQVLLGQRNALDAKLASIRSTNQHLNDSAPLLRAIGKQAKKADRIILRAEIAERVRRIDVTFDAEFLLSPGLTGNLAEAAGVGTLVTIHFVNGSTRYMRLAGEKLILLW
jgi:hypothetical protein